MGTSCAIGALLLVGELQAQDFSYTNNNGTITITGYTGPGEDVVPIHKLMEYERQNYFEM